MSKQIDIDPQVLADLMNGLFTCYWCGAVYEMELIGDHVDNCLREVNWLRKHVEEA